MKPHLSGAFIQLNTGHTTEPADLWEARLARMKAAGMDIVIIQFSAYNGVDLGVAVDRVFRAAEALSMIVWLGAPLEERSWWRWNWSPFYLRSIRQQAAQETFAAVSRWAAEPALGGVYLPYETNGVGDPVAMGKFLGALSQAAKRARPEVPVLISPFTNLTPGRLGALPPRVLTAWWEVVLARAGVDVVAWQDGVGGVEAQLDQVARDFGAIARAARKHRLQVWANVESFARTTPLDQPFAATAAEFARFRRQLEAVAPLAERIITFDYNDYMDPEAGENARRLYEAYMAYKKTTAPKGGR